MVATGVRSTATAPWKRGFVMFTTRSAPTDPARRGLWRSRWAAIGAAVAVSLGAGGFFVAQAAPGPSESTIVTVTPERILDTRDGNDIGLPGPFVSAVSQKLKVTGSIPTATGTKTVVPAGATGVLLNVTPVNATADGFISIRPGDASGAATTSSLNFTRGDILPNSVQVGVPTSGANAGKIDITFDAYGVAGPTTDILIDVVGYMTSAGLQDLTARLATAEQQLAANRAVFVNDGVGVDVTTEEAIASMSLSNDVPCNLLLNGTVDWDGNGAAVVLFMGWSVDGADVGGEFADQTEAVEINDSLSAVGGKVINPGTHTIELRARASGGTGSIEDVGATAQCVPFDGSGNPAALGADGLIPQSTDDPNDPTD